MGVELVKYGFKNITATDYCQEMLDAAKEKGKIKYDNLIYFWKFSIKSCAKEILTVKKH